MKDRLKDRLIFFGCATLINTGVLIGMGYELDQVLTHNHLREIGNYAASFHGGNMEDIIFVERQYEEKFSEHTILP